MKMFIVKLLTAIAVVLTMYASVVVVHDDGIKNSQDITTLNRKIVLLEETIEELNNKTNSLSMLVKSLRTSIQEREINVDKKVQDAIDNKFKEQSATGSVGVLTNDKAIEEQLNDT